MKKFTFKKALPIWLDNDGECKAKADEFVDFAADFNLPTNDPNDKIEVSISADSDYILRINDKTVSFGQYLFYPPIYSTDTIDITEYVVCGNNRINISVWYYGVDSQTYKKGVPFLCFEIFNSKDVFCCSDENILSKPSDEYISYKCHKITNQLGLAYSYNNAGVENEESHSVMNGMKKSIPAPCDDIEFILRPVKKLNLGRTVCGCIVKSCCYKYNGESDMASVIMQQADLCESGGQGVCIIVDLGCEYAGYLSFDIDIDTAPSDDTDNAYRLMIGYGEHLCDGRCRTNVGGRNFAFDYYARKGNNNFTGFFRRLGCRYIQIFAENLQPNELRIGHIGLIPANYPINKKPHRYVDTQKEIYDTSVRTLECCMHEHYEDCPWREQALYTLDSRNQILCGYHVFENGNRDFVRANLELISHGLRHDGLLSLCYPAGLDFPIPSYSLAYFIEVDEYLQYTNDTSFAYAVFDILEIIMNTFIAKINNSGLVNNFYGDGGYWNFYEWSPTMSGKFNEDKCSVEAPLNAFLSLALRCLGNICNKLFYDCSELKYQKKAEECLSLSKSVNNAIYREFYDKSLKIFSSYDNKHIGKYSVLTNALCVLCGAAENKHMDDLSVIEAILAENGLGGNENVIPCTLAMDCFRYDALLSINYEKYKSTVLADIEKKYKEMLDNGATTFWETIKGESDFHGAGSLCHGWSAMPVYYYSILQ